ncbi:MAG: aminoglycoside phosphotransferase family protein [Anaerolineaceae bacterium]|nr:aminoglycoside phosphotransferase family protein [Anaerolineaceae bacterium]
MNRKPDLLAIQNYLQSVDLSAVPGWEKNQEVKIFHLAQGEYNLNYRLQQGSRQWVFRINLGTQNNRDDQIMYEYQALCLLADTGVTPRPFFVDDSREHLPYGVLLMEYLPGDPLDYERDLEGAARLFSRIHSQSAKLTDHHLIVEAYPLSMTYNECADLLQVYFDSELSDPDIFTYLQEVLDWAKEARHKESYFISDPWPCVINTEVNSGNFIVNRDAGSLHLVDWEKPLWGDPSQDLSHFCVPTTTLWKTRYRMPPADREKFLSTYCAAMRDTHLSDTIIERVRLRDPFNCLRGISWSAMAWISYQNEDHALKNEDTFRKIEEYLQLDFLQSLFSKILS